MGKRRCGAIAGTQGSSRHALPLTVVEDAAPKRKTSMQKASSSRQEHAAGRPMEAVAMLVVAAALMAGCASRSSVMPMGQGDFTITKEASSGFFGTATLKVDALQEANEYCTTFGKNVQVTNITETKPPYVLSNYPRVDLQFKCVNRLFEPDQKR
jgi:hypothetical protein